MTSLFISYSRKDVDVAKKLTNSFNGQGLDFWIDWEGIPLTVDWWKEIEKGIEEADIFLFLLSPDSAQSNPCKQEIEHATKNGKRLIPIVVRDVKANDSPPELRPLNWTFLREEDDFKTNFEKLINAINTDYEWVQVHRQLLVKALEWERSGYENSFLLRGKELQDAEIQFATNSSKDPNPIKLQREYALKSRQATDRQRRITTGISISGIIALAALAPFGFFQAELATTNEKIAVNNASTAQVASTLAVSNEATAVANEQEAKRQANIALARQLSAQAESIYDLKDSREMLAVLLAIQASSILPSWEASAILQNNTLVHPTSIENLYPISVRKDAFSADEKYVAVSGYDKTVRVSEIETGVEIRKIIFDSGTLAFSFDGRYLAMASESFSDVNLVLIWDIEANKEIARLEHEASISSIAFSPDGRYLTSGSSDGRVHLWKISNNYDYFVMVHEGPVTSVDFSPDGKYIVSGSEDGTVRVWDVATGSEVTRINQGGVVSTVKFSPHGEYIASAGCKTGLNFGGIRCPQRGIVQIWDTTSGMIISQMSHDDLVTSLDFSNDGRHVVSGSFDNTARVWEVDTGKEVARMTHDNYVLFVNFLQDDSKIISRTAANFAWVWGWSPSNNNVIMNHGSPIWSFAFSQNGEYLISGTGDYIARTWNVDTGTEVAEKTHDFVVESVIYGIDDKYVISAGGNTVYTWEPQTGTEIAHITRDNQFSTLALSSDGSLLVAGGCDQRDKINHQCTHGIAYILETLTGVEKAQIIHNAGVYSVAFSPDGSLVASGGCDERGNNGICIKGTTHLLQLNTEVEIASITHNSTVRSVVFSPDGKYLISGSQDKTASIWDIKAGKEIARVNYGDIRTVAVSPDGRYMAVGGCDKRDVDTACMDGSVIIREVSTGLEISRIIHENQVNSVAFSPDSKYIISGGWENTARVWEVVTGKEISRVIHNGIVVVVAFSPDGKYAASGSEDGVIHLWIWNPEDLVSNACSRVTRNLSRVEWKQYIGDVLPYRAVCENLPIEPEETPTP